MNPATGASLPSEPNTPESDLPRIFKEARKAQQIWARRTFKQRAKALQKAKRYLADHAEEGARIISQYNGKTRSDALGAEIVSGLMCMDWYFDNTASVLAPQKLANGHILFANKRNTIHHVPIGVVGIISPWNYPFAIPYGEVIMGLMAGNAVILKVASNVTAVGAFIDRIIGAAVGDGDNCIPRGLFTHVVLSGAKAGPLLLGENTSSNVNRVDKLFFTGSVDIGKQLMCVASKHLVPLSLELGGKDPMIVMADADLERASNAACWAGYQNSGQSCGGVERVYVHDAVWDKFLGLMIKKTKALTHGPDTGAIGDVQMGAVTTKGQLATIKKQVDDAVAAGAKIIAQSSPKGDCSGGFFYPATLMVDVDHQMSLMREETFGPVVPLMKFSTEEEAIRLANDCDLALTSSVFTSSGATGRRVALAVEAGVTSVNDHLYSHGQAETPWGGWKESGLGRTHGVLGLKEMTNAKLINEDLFPTSRDLWWYPLDHATYLAMVAMIDLLAPKSIFHYVGAASRLLPTAVKKMFSAWKP